MSFEIKSTELNTKQMIDEEMANATFRHIPTAIIGTILAVLFVAYFFWNKNSYTKIWLIFFLIHNIYSLYFFSHTSSDSIKKKISIALYLSTIFGALWGIGLVLLFPYGSQFEQILYINIFTLLIIGAAYCYASLVSILYAMIITYSIFLCVTLITSNSLSNALPFLIQLAFFPFTIYFSKSFNKVLRESFELRFANDALLKNLQLKNTEIATAYQNIEQQKEIAEHANLAKSQFLAAAGHDLRQPMHALNLYLAHLNQLELTQSVKSIVQRMESCSKGMSTLFQSLLDVSRLDAAAIQPEIQHFALERIFERLRVQFLPQAEAKGLKLRVRSTDVWVHSDPVLVERILHNLVSNAIRYTEQGKILVGCRRDQKNVLISVYDTGIGIPEDQIQPIFSEFYQVNNPERDRNKGIGLGLAIVDRLAKLLDIQLKVSSTVGKGSAFTFKLTRSHETVNEFVLDPASPDSEPTATPLNQLHVVLIDDEQTIRDAMSGWLEHSGCHVTTAGSGQEALIKLSSVKRTPDILLCDYRLRDHEVGPTVIEKIREEFNHEIPAILISGDTAPEWIQEIAATNLTVLHKPIDPALLLKRIREVT